jgi:hypothetical protein
VKRQLISLYFLVLEIFKLEDEYITQIRMVETKPLQDPA